MKTTSRLPIAPFLMALSFVSCEKEEKAKNNVQPFVTSSDSADVNARILIDFVTAHTAAD